ncbi:hypothetical protein HPB50_028785 [Hyalomma asiaticum]|nr:hypothetical protein HPB50_028785 [Hyalomma asiaticum]
MSQVGVGEEDDLSPEEKLKWRQTHIYDAAYQDSLRKDVIAATAKAAVWQQMVSRNNEVRPPKLPEGSYNSPSFSLRQPAFEPPWSYAKISLRSTPPPTQLPSVRKAMTV